MLPYSRLISGLLLIAFAAAVPGIQLYAMPTGHPAGCHDPGTPSPAVPSYQCCIGGHHWAIPGAAFTIRPMAGTATSPEHRDHSIGDVSIPLAMLVAPSVSPPGLSPLRI